MGLFVCVKCKCIDNTALGLYWSRKRTELFIWEESNEPFKGKALCSECAPKSFRDGTPTMYGKWHGCFPKEHVSKMTEEQLKHIYYEKEE